MSVEYQIYTTRDIEAALSELIQQKERKGYNVSIHHYENLPEPKYKTMRDRILDSNPDYLLLVGDHDTLPGYPRERELPRWDPRGDPKYTSDTYFSIPDNKILPQVETGRLSSKEPEVIENICRSIVSYENINNSSWSQKVVLTGWLPRGPSHPDYDTDCAVECLREIGHYFLPILEFERSALNSSTAEALQRWGAEESNKERLKRAIENAAIVRYVGHGNEISWTNVGYDFREHIRHPDGSSDIIRFNQDFTNNDIRDLNVGEKLPLVLSMACLTGRIEAFPSFAEFWQTEGKAIGILCADKPTATWVMDRLPQCIFRQIVRYRNRKAGSLIYYSMRDFLTRYVNPEIPWWDFYLPDWEWLPYPSHPNEWDYHTLQMLRYLGDPDTTLAFPSPSRHILEEKSRTGPAVVAVHDTVFIAWVDEDLRLNIKKSTDGGRHFTDKRTLSNTSYESPAITNFNGKYFLAWIGTDDRNIYIRVSDNGLDWSDSNVIRLSEKSHSSPALKKFGDSIYLAWRGLDNRINITRSSNGIDNWSDKVTLQERAYSGVALTATLSNLILAWRGGPTNNKINIMTSQNGSYFQHKNVLLETTTSDLALTNYLGRPMVAWRGLNDYLLNVAEGYEFRDYSGRTQWGSKITWGKEKCGYGGPSLTYQGALEGLLCAWTGTDMRINIMIYPVAPAA